MQSESAATVCTALNVVFHSSNAVFCILNLAGFICYLYNSILFRFQNNTILISHSCLTSVKDRPHHDTVFCLCVLYSYLMVANNRPKHVAQV
jgi:hypothetical protein